MKTLASRGVVAAVTLLGCTASHGEPDSTGGAFPNRRPRFESPGHLLGYVANRQSDSVSVLDLDAMTALGEVPVGRDPIDIDGPRHVLVDTQAGALYVVLSYPLVATSPHAIANNGGPREGYVVELALDDLRPLGAVRVAASPADLAESDDGRLLVAPHADTVLALKAATDIDGRRATVALIEPAAGMADGSAAVTLAPTCVAPSALVLNPAGTRAYVACTGEDSLAVLDTEQHTVLARVPAGANPSNKPVAISRSADGTLLALSNQVSRAVVVFAASDAPSALLSIPVPGVPFATLFKGLSELVVPLQGPSGAVRVDVATGSIIQARTYTDDECLNPSDASAVTDGRLFLVCEGDHYRPGRLVAVDAESLAITASVTLGVYPDRLAVLEP